jgi:hypothetical protein
MPLIIAELLREQAITMVDLAQFSPGLRKRVKGICTIEERKDSPFSPSTQSDAYIQLRSGCGSSVDHVAARIENALC